MSIEEVVALIADTPDCILRPCAGQPFVAEPHLLPDDLVRFYDLCGGAILFESATYSTSIVPPQGIVPANPVIIGEIVEGDISETWYILADDLNGDYFRECLKLLGKYSSAIIAHA